MIRTERPFNDSRIRLIVHGWSIVIMPADLETVINALIGEGETE